MSVHPPAHCELNTNWLLGISMSNHQVDKDNNATNQQQRQEVIAFIH